MTPVAPPLATHLSGSARLPKFAVVPLQSP